MNSRTISRKKIKTKSHARLTDRGYRRLAELRYTMRQFLAFSELAAHNAGLTPQQHQALLVIKGLCITGRASVGEIAARLLTRHHSAVELIDRLAARNLVRRVVDSEDRRRVFVSLAPRAEKLLAALSAVHLAELRRIRRQLIALLEKLE